MSVLATAWRVVVKRAVADRLILSAAAITIILATALLAMGPIYADAVTLSGARRTLADAELTDANVEITLRARSETYAANDQRVLDELPATFGFTGGTVWQQLVSGSYQLPVQPSDGFTDVGVFKYRQRIEDHASLVAGTWPVAGDEPFQTAVSQATAARLDLDVGDELLMTNRTSNSLEAVVVVVGIFRPDQPEAAYWFGDELDVEGVVEGTSFRTHGPFVVDLETLLLALSPTSVEINWRVFPDFNNIAVADVAEMGRRVSALEARLNAGLPTASFIVDTKLPRILSEIERSLLATRSGVLTLTVQLAMLAGYALLLTAGLLAESRRVETNLLRSRGASGRQVFWMSGMEGIILTVPAALAAPWLAAGALRLLNSFGPLALIGLTIDPVVSPAAYVLSFVAAAGCVVALAAPARRSARSFGQSTMSPGREQARNILQSGGVDIALLLLAAVGFWQLRRYGGQITATLQGRLGVDPVLIAAPTLGLLAGAVLALRTIPLIARIAERSAAGGASSVRALAAWQVARRPARHSRSSLLLILAVSIGLLAATYTTTWNRSQEDQADYQVGADVRVSPNRRTNDSIPEINLRDAHAQVPGVAESMALVRHSGEIRRPGGTGRFIMMDARRAADVVEIREDLATRRFTDLMAELADRRPEFTVIGLPGSPQRVAVEVAVAVEPLAEGFENPPEGTDEQLEFEPTASLVLQDGNGLLHRVQLGPVPVDAGVARLAADLTYPLADGHPATPTYPLSLMAIEFRSQAPFLTARIATINVSSIAASDQTAGDTWQVAAANLDPGAWEVSHSGLSPAFSPPSVEFAAEPSGDGLEFVVNSGVSVGRFPLPVHFGLRPQGDDPPSILAAIVSDEFMTITDSEVGDEVRLDLPFLPDVALLLVGTIARFPTVDAEFGEAVLLDLPTVQMLRYETGAAIDQVTERWLSATDGSAAVVAADLRMAPYESRRVVDRMTLSESLKADPVALGTIGSLTLGFVAAAVFAAVGFAVSAIVSARERVTEFALLRAVGLSPRQLGGWLSLEHGALVAISLVFGSLLGWLLAWLILPLITVTQQATAAVPDVMVVYPWNTIVQLELGVMIVFAAIVVGLSVTLRRLGLSMLLRLGED